ncbi:MAG: transporter [Polaromonas sp.]|nr:transporter [Polaromonas sp.]
MHLRRLRVTTLLLLSSCAAAALAAEDFRVRYNVAGTLGGEIFATQDTSGWIGAVAYTYIDGRKLTGADGRELSITTPAGTLALPAPTPAALYPAYDAKPVALQTSGHASVAVLALGYITEELYGGGQIIFGALLPIAQNASNVMAIAASPTLRWAQPAQPDDTTKTLVQSGFDAGYQDGLSAQTAAESGQTTGIGDIELAAAWMIRHGPWKFRAGAALVLPTGSYSATSRPNIGFGNFHTLRPELQATYLPSAKIALSGKLIIGFNTRNKDKQLKSGDWFGLEAAAAYMTPIGPVGLHGVHVRQYQDDENNLSFGSSRLELTGLGVFFTTKMPVMDAIVTLQYMVTTSSRNARHSNFSQLRIIKQF